MIDIIGFLIVAALFASGNVFAILAASIWLVIGIYSVRNSRSRGVWADMAFLFGAPIYWIVEG